MDVERRLCGLSQLPVSANMIKMPMGVNDCNNPETALFDLRKDAINLIAGINHNPLSGGFAPEYKAIDSQCTNNNRIEDHIQVSFIYWMAFLQQPLAAASV